MKRTEWNKESPLSTPQFNSTKSQFYENKHIEGAILANERLKTISKPGGGKSEIIYEVLKQRNSFEETLNKLKKSYLMKERQAFQMIENEDELNLLIATRPKILEIQSKVQAGEGRFIDDYRGFRGVSPESKVKSKLKKEFEERQSDLMRDLEQYLKEKVEVSKAVVEEYWVEKVKELEEKLEDLENEEWENKEFLNQLSQELENKYKGDYEKKRKNKVFNLTKKEKEGNILKFQAELEIDQMNFLDRQKESWKKEGVREVQDACKEKFKEEQEQAVARREKELKKQGENEAQSIISQLTKDTEEAVYKKISEISENQEIGRLQLEENWKEEAYQEHIIELEESFKLLIRDKVKQSIDKEIKKNLSQRVEMEVKIRLEDFMYNEIVQEHEENHEIFRKKIEQEQANKLIEMEIQIEIAKKSEFENLIEKKFSKIEKDQKISYLKKIDKLKSELRKEYEEIYIGQIKKIRNLLIQEKSETARIKSQINVFVSKTSNEAASEIRSLQEQEVLYDKKIRDISLRQQYEDEGSRKRTPENSKSPLTKTPSAFSPLPQNPESELSRSIPKPLPPPSLCSFDEVKKKDQSPERRLLKVYDTKEIANSLILKNYEEAHKQAWLTLKETEEPRTKSTYAEISELLSSGRLVPRETPKKRSLYNELLNKKYGVIEPRIK